MMVRDRLRPLVVGILGVALVACGSTGGSAGGASGSGGASPAAAKSSASSSSNSKPLHMTIGYTAYGSNYGPLYVAEDMGLFKQEGLDVKLVYIESSSQLVAGLESGSAQVVLGSGESALNGVVKGFKNLRIIGQMIPNGFLEVWGQPNIHSAKDLIGKKMSSTSPGSLGSRLIPIWLKKNGVNPSQVKIVYVGGLSNIVASVRSDRVAATLILPPLGEPLAAAGKHRIGDLRNIPYAAVMYITTTKFSGKHPSALVRMFKATAKAISILETQPKKVLPILAKYTKIKKPSWNEYAYNYYKPVWKTNPTVDMKVITATQQVTANPKVKDMNATPYVDNSFAKQLVASGYLKTLPK